MKPAHLPALDGLRGIAILLVIVNHTVGGTFLTPTLPVDQAARFVASICWMGVDLFFVLSGFLVTGILLDTKGQPNWWRNFMARRALRIFPIYYAALVILFVILPRTGWQDPEFAVLKENQAWFWTYMVNFLDGITRGKGTPLGTGHLWSLSIEEQFYFLWPLLIWRCRPKTLLWICALMPIGGLLFRAWCVFHLHNAPGAYLFTPGRCDALLVGAALAIGARQAEGLVPWRRWARPALMISLGGLALLVAYEGFSIESFNIRNTSVALVTYPLMALLFGAVLLMVVTGSGESAFGRALRNPTLRRWGIYSYGIYIVHYPLVSLFQRQLDLSDYSAAWAGGAHLPALLELTGIVMALSYAAAWCSYHGYEKHFLRLKRYFERPGNSIGSTPPLVPVSGAARYHGPEETLSHHRSPERRSVQRVP